MNETFLLNKFDHKTLKNIIIIATKFFNPLNYEWYCNELGIIPNKNIQEPFTGFQFYTYITKKYEEFKNHYNEINFILICLEKHCIINRVNNYGPIFIKGSFYSFFKPTKCQKINYSWVNSILGLSGLYYFFSKNVVHICGTNKDNTEGNGSGFMISPNKFITCKHNFVDMKVNEIKILEKKFNVKNIIMDDLLDIALVEINESINNLTIPPFKNANVLDECIVMGYPPISGSDSDYLLALKGEINSSIHSYLNKCKCNTFSSIIRPGMSGGALISEDGYFIGMTNETCEKCLAVSVIKGIKDNLVFPYSTAIQGDVIFNTIKKLDPTLNINFEDYTY